MKGDTGNEKLRRLRLEAKNWTKEELARVAGLSAQTVRKAERGLAVSEVSMAKLAKLLGPPLRNSFPVEYESTATPLETS